MKGIVLVPLVLAAILGPVAACDNGKETTVPDVVNAGIDGDPTDLDSFSTVQFKATAVTALFAPALSWLSKRVGQLHPYPHGVPQGGGL